MGTAAQAREVFGLVKTVKGPESRLRMTFAVSPEGFPLKVKVAWSVVMVPDGRESMTVSGGGGYG